MFLFMTSFNLILPELNNFITALGGEEQKGLVISLFTISAGISRPFSGKLSDKIGRKKVMVIGVLVCFLTSILYPLSFSVWFFLLLRFFHGFSAGFTPTGATALITDMIAAVTAALSGILLAYVQETLILKEKFKITHLRIRWNDVFEPTVLPSAMVMFLSATCSGIIFVLTPDMSAYLGIQNKGWFFGIYVISTIIIRLMTSSLSDRIGRRKTLIIGMIFLIASMIMIGYSKDIVSYTVAAIIFGIATGISSPTFFAWTADLSAPDRRGVGAGTMFIALELGIMFGSASTLLTYENDLDSIPIGFLVGAGTAFLAVIYLIWHLMRRHSHT